MSDAEDSPPWEIDEGRFSVTLKGHKDYSATWVSLSDKTAGGLRRRIIAFFGWTDAESAELPLSQLVFNATQEMHALHAVGSTFSGARATSGGSAARDRAFASTSGEQAAPDPKAVLLAQIEEQESADALRRLYGENKAAFDADPDLLAAYKARGRSLTA